jgi:hypothetical protein
MKLGTRELFFKIENRGVSLSGEHANKICVFSESLEENALWKIKFSKTKTELKENALRKTLIN